MIEIEEELNKYCVYVEKISCEKVMVYAKSRDEAVNKVSDACEKDKIDFCKPIDVRYES